MQCLHPAGTAHIHTSTPFLQIACILLPLTFTYDVFWVFIQPMLFGGGKSVMVEVRD